jgi:branched-chain amino acid transport system permease protein
LLFRALQPAPALIKVVATIGLSVALPAITTAIFGNAAILSAPGLAPEPVHIFLVAGAPVTLNQVITYGCLLAFMIIGSAVLRYTDVGLRVRAMVDSEAMTSLSGVSPVRISVGVWITSTFLAGVVGVLAAPVVGLTTDAYTLIIAAAFSAVIAAKLRSFPVAIVVSLAMGIVGSLLTKYIPPASAFAAAAIPSIPFAFIIVFLLYHVVRGTRLDEAIGVGGKLDQAIRTHGGSSLITAASKTTPSSGRLVSRRRLSIPTGPFLALCVVVCLPWLLGGLWVSLIGEGIALGVVFLSFTLVTGEGGMIWLSQAALAGLGANTAAHLATVNGLPVLLAVVAGGIVAALVGLVLAFVTVRLGDLYSALVTLSFGLLVENLVFQLPVFFRGGQGETVGRPVFAGSNRAFDYLAMVVFCLVALIIVNLRSSTAGLALRAVRWSERGASTIGVNVLQVKVLTCVLAALIAGIGGGMLALYANAAIPNAYSTLTGLVWFAILVTFGVRSITAAGLAGLAYILLPALAAQSQYLSTTGAELLPALFGLGAIMVSRNPEGILAAHARQIGDLLRRRGGPRSQSEDPLSADESQESTVTPPRVKTQVPSEV